MQCQIGDSLPNVLLTQKRSPTIQLPQQHLRSKSCDPYKRMNMSNYNDSENQRKFPVNENVFYQPSNIDQYYESEAHPIHCLGTIPTFKEKRPIPEIRIANRSIPATPKYVCQSKNVPNNTKLSHDSQGNVPPCLNKVC